MNTFTEAGLSDALLSALEDLNFVKPTPIQEQTLGLLLHSEQDLVGLAQTGTGKTAAFSLPIIHQTDLKSKNVQSIVLCPTRELCLQIGKDVESYTKYLKGFRVECIYGGTSIDRQIKALKRGCHMIVGTPGRTLDMIKRKKLNLSQVRWLVLDEADEMLNMGFKEDLNAILSNTPSEKQTLLFSATMPKEISRISKEYMDNPIEISVGNKNAGAKNVSHEYFFSAPRDRYGTLKNIIDSNPSIYAIVFCRTRKETKDVASKLRKHGYAADALHGELSQAQRDNVMRSFRDHRLQIMVATDVAARGLDVDHLTHVINFNLPDELEAYIHRSGRTGRAGQSGKSIAIIHSREKSKIGRLEKKLGKKFTAGVLPSRAELTRKHLFNYISHIESIEPKGSLLEPILPEILKKIEWLSKEELIAKLLMMEIDQRGLASVGKKHESRDRGDKKRTEDGRKKRHKDRGREDRGREDRPYESRRKEERRKKEYREVKQDAPEFSRFYMNIGSKKKLNPKDLLSLLNEQMRGDSFEIGKIEIFKSFSFFEIDSAYEKNVLKAFHKAKYKGEKLKVEQAQPRRPGDTGR